MTLIEFLLARLAEDEAFARGFRLGGKEWAGTGTPADPARMLAECEAKRRMLELLDTEVIGWDELDVGYSPEDWLAKQIARTMALSDAAHTDYDETWRP